MYSWGVLKGLHYKILDIILWSISQVSFFQFYTPPSIEQYGLSNPNGALWTISMEIQIYFFIMLFWKKLEKCSTSKWILIIIIAIIFNVIFGYLDGVIPLILFKLINVTFLSYLYVFLIGMFCYAKQKEAVPFLRKYFWILIVLFVVWHFINSIYIHLKFGQYTNIFKGILISLVTISAAYKFGKHRIKREISYGLYIYHMVIVNVFVMFDLYGRWSYAIIVFIVSILIALLSKKYIEIPAIRRF